MFDELNSAFPNHTHFYEITGIGFGEAMENCARLAAGDPHVLNFNGKIIFATQRGVSVTDIDWLSEVAGSPVEPVVIEEVPAEEIPAEPAKSK